MFLKAVSNPLLPLVLADSSSLHCKQEHIEFKDRNAAEAATVTATNTTKTSGGGGCCTIV
jgi:hypothetical protein